MPRKLKWSPYENYNDVPVDTVLPTKKFIPEWYKKFPPIISGGNANIIPTPFTVKKCIPFLDTFTSGYVLTTMCDIGFVKTIDENNQENIQVTWWDILPPLVGSRGGGNIPLELIPIGFSKAEFTWRIQETIEIPKGYSMLWTHPLNRNDLPFHTVSGIVDGGWSMYGGNIPFFIKEGFEGLIPAGTPFIQIIPFKNESWISKKDFTLIKKGDIQKKLRFRPASEWYKHTWWNKKSYE
jgi:hypothetical protein